MSSVYLGVRRYTTPRSDVVSGPLQSNAEAQASRTASAALLSAEDDSNTVDVRDVTFRRRRGCDRHTHSLRQRNDKKEACGIGIALQSLRRMQPGAQPLPQ